MNRKRTNVISSITKYLSYIGILTAIIYSGYYFYNSVTIKYTSNFFILANNDSNNCLIGILTAMVYLKHSKNSQILSNIISSSNDNKVSIGVFSNHEKENMMNEQLINLKKVTEVRFYFQDMELFNYVTIQNHFQCFKIFEINQLNNCDVDINGGEIVDDDLTQNKITYNYKIEKILGMSHIVCLKDTLSALYYYMLGKEELTIKDNSTNKAFRIIIQTV